MNEWDKRLIERHLSFYEQLASGQREPTTEAQRHFVKVIQKTAAPRTQHEIAYIRFLGQKLRRPDPALVPAGTPETLDPNTGSSTEAIAEEVIVTVEHSIDQIEQLQWNSRASQKLETLFSIVKSKYRAEARRIGDGASVASLWVTSALSDREWAAAVGQWSGSQFNTLSNVYTKAMDGQYVDGLVAGVQNISPSLHRLFDGNHTVVGAWDAVRSAISSDSYYDEVKGYTQAFLSDLSSTTGMPIISITPKTYEILLTLVERAGISSAWLNDALHMNAEEILGSTLPGLAVLLNWNKAESEEFLRMLGGLAVATTYAANPVGGLLLIVAAARSFQLSRHSEKPTATIASAFVEGGFLTGIVVASSVVIGGPIWIGMVAGLVLAIFAKKSGQSIHDLQLVSFMKHVVGASSPAMLSR